MRDLKSQLRKRVLAARNALAPAVHSADSSRIAAAIAALPTFAQSRTVLLTLPFGSEWNVRPLALLALEQRKRVAIPRVEASTHMLMLHAIGDLERDVVSGFRAIPEPEASLPRLAPALIDWVLVPGAAFDQACRRLGYGGGYYDRLLPLLNPEVPRVAGAFDCQIVADVPVAAHDEPVDRIVTPTRSWLRPGARA
jgi:5-formyltetrahydrofolate cyclo-ligase